MSKYVEIDHDRMRTDSRYAAWARARTGAERTRSRVLDDDDYAALVEARKAQRRDYGTAEHRFVRDHYRAHARPAVSQADWLKLFQHALYNLHADIDAGLPAAALAERIDDELFKLKR